MLDAVVVALVKNIGQRDRSLRRRGLDADDRAHGAASGRDCRRFSRSAAYHWQ